MPTGNEVSAGRHWPHAHSMASVNSILFSCFRVMADSPSTVSDQRVETVVCLRMNFVHQAFPTSKVVCNIPASGWLKFHH